MRSKKIKIVVGAGLLFLALKWWFAGPSEAQLKANFAEHRADFQQLRAMVEQDASNDYSGVHISGNNAEVDGRRPLSSSRIEKYGALMRRTGVFGIHGGRRRCRMLVTGGGFTDTSWSIGYSFSRSQPDIVVPSVYRWGARQNHTAFARLDGDWYLFNSR